MPGFSSMYKVGKYDAHILFCFKMCKNLKSCVLYPSYKTVTNVLMHFWLGFVCAFVWRSQFWRAVLLHLGGSRASQQRSGLAAPIAHSMQPCLCKWLTMTPQSTVPLLPSWYILTTFACWIHAVTLEDSFSALVKWPCIKMSMHLA